MILDGIYCYGCYKPIEYPGAKERLGRINELEYPYSKVIKYIQEKNIIVYERVFGERCDDNGRNSIVIHSLIETSKKSPVIEREGILYQFQHCDFGYNILWENDKFYKCIDVDYVNEAPVFTDLLIFLLKQCTNIEYLENQIKKYPEIEAQVLQLFPDSNNWIDDLLSNFVLGVRSIGYTTLACFVAYLDLSKYAKTKKSLNGFR